MEAQNNMAHQNVGPLAKNHGFTSHHDNSSHLLIDLVKHVTQYVQKAKDLFLIVVIHQYILLSISYDCDNSSDFSCDVKIVIKHV